MRNFNELVGIIKGISFDCVINGKEIKYLNSWLHKNRNLFFEQKQVDFIRLIDSVFEDHIINNDKKKLLLASVEEHLKHTKDSIGKLYELNGIIKGILCDNELNNTEIYYLKDYLENCDDSIKEFNPVEELLANIESDNIKLFETLTEKTKNLQFEIKLYHLCSKVKERKNIGIDLLNILDNESDVTRIHKRAQAQLRSILGSYSGSFYKKEDIIFVSLALIAMLEYDGNYYSNVRSTYTQIYERFPEQKIEGLIRDILKYIRPDVSSSRSRIITVALENAIVPQAFLPAFFDFIFDIYKINFEYDLSDELYEDFRFVFEGLRNNIHSDVDDISVNITRKTYKLIASTKKLLLREDGLDALVKLSIKIIWLINRYYWRKNVEIHNPYLKSGFDGWKKQFNETSESTRRSGERAIPEFRSRWEPQFMLKNFSVYLVPPVHRVKADYEYKNIAVEVLNDGKIIYKKDDCLIKEIIGGYQIEPPEINVDSPLGKLTYRLVCGAEVIYESKEKLHRNYIVFNEEGQEINNNTDYEGTVYICYKPEDAQFQKIAIRDYYCIGYELIRIGNTLRIGSDVFSFSSVLKPGILGSFHKNCFLSTSDVPSNISVYQEIKDLVFEADNISDKFEIILNDKPHKLSEMTCKTIAGESITRYIAELNLENSGIYTIEVNQILPGGNKKKIHKEHFAYDPHLYYDLEALDDEHYRIKVSSGLFNSKIDSVIFVDDFSIDFIRFDYAGKTYSYLIPFDFGFYKINDEVNWNISSKPLWIDDIALDTIIQLYDSECDSLVIYNENNSLLEENIAIQDNGIYKSVSIGFLQSYKTGNRYVKLLFSVDDKAKYIVTCYNSSVLDEKRTKIFSLDAPKRILVTPVYHGNNNIYFEVLNKKDEIMYIGSDLKSGQTEEVIKEFSSFEEYTFIFYEKTKSLTFIRNPIYQINKVFYSKQDFVGREFKIDIIYLQQFIGNDCNEKPFFLNKAYVQITNIFRKEESFEGAVLEKEYFEGAIFIESSKGSWYLDRINPVEIEIFNDIADGTMEVYMRSNTGDGLLFENGKILNSLSSKTATDIYLYTLKVIEES